MNLLVIGSLSHLATNFILKYGIRFNKIIAIDRVSYCSQSKEIINSMALSGTFPYYKFIEIDATDADIENIVIFHSITHILNCAASTHVDKSYEDTSIFSKDNIELVSKLMQSIVELKKLKYDVYVIHLSTDEVYGDDYATPRKEVDMLSPTNPYSATKASGDMIINSYCYSYNLWNNIIVLRPNNMAGLYQYPDKIIPLFYRLIKKNKLVNIHGNGLQKRCFILTEHICDIIFVLLLNSNLWDGSSKNIFYNVAYNRLDGVKVIDVYNIIKSIINKDHSNVNYIRDRPYNDKKYTICNNKLINLLSQIKKQTSNIYGNKQMIDHIFNILSENSEDAIKYVINQMISRDQFEQ